MKVSEKRTVVGEGLIGHCVSPQPWREIDAHGHVTWLTNDSRDDAYVINDVIDCKYCLRSVYTEVVECVLLSRMRAAAAIRRVATVSR